MDPALSITKGVFVFKNGVTPRNTLNEDDSLTHARRETNQSALKTYWRRLEKSARKIYERNYDKTVLEIENFITDCDEHNVDGTLVAAALLTGINQPDHSQQFETLAKHIQRQCSALCIILDAKKSQDLFALFGQIVNGFMRSSKTNEHDEVKQSSLNFQRQLCTMRVLELWYREEFPDSRKKLVIIIPSFECYKAQILHDMILILQAYCKRLPIILVLGVATAVSSLHKRLPYHISSKMQLRIFQFEPAITGLNSIIEQTILSPARRFYLFGKVFSFLTDTFLFYDFSINGMLQGIKICLIEYSLQRRDILPDCKIRPGALGEFSEYSHETLEAIRQLPSFRRYIENITDKPYEIILLLTDDECLKDELPVIIIDCWAFLFLFRCFLEFFSNIVVSLPKTPLGRSLGEIYSRCVSSNIWESHEFTDCWQMLSLLSKSEFVLNIEAARDKMMEYFNENVGYNNNNNLRTESEKVIVPKVQKLNLLLDNVRKAEIQSQSKSTQDPFDLLNQNRCGIEETLLEMPSNNEKESNLKECINEALIYIKSEIVCEYLIPLAKEKCPPLVELFVFSGLWSVKPNIVGTPRSAMHTALNDPHYYLECDCCELQLQTDLLKSMPDVCIVYKLHLESGRMINLYDCLLAFRCVIGEDGEDGGEAIDPEIQARFARAVAELQFLGYVKSSTRKTDHVARLTW